MIVEARTLFFLKSPMPGSLRVLSGSVRVRTRAHSLHIFVFCPCLFSKRIGSAQSLAYIRPNDQQTLPKVATKTTFFVHSGCGLYVSFQVFLGALKVAAKPRPPIKPAKPGRGWSLARQRRRHAASAVASAGATAHCSQGFCVKDGVCQAPSSPLDQWTRKQLSMAMVQADEGRGS